MLSDLRMGADTVNVVPHSHYETRDGSWVALACSNERMWGRLCRAMGRPDLIEDPRYSNTPKRAERRAEVNAIVAQWVASLDVDEVLAACEANDAPVSKLLSISDIFANPQYRERENLRTLDDPRAGRLVVPAPVPRLSRTPSELRTAGPGLGDSNQEYLGDLLGLDGEQLADLKARNII